MPNTVSINVGARDEGATANLEALKARLEELGRKRETAQVSLDGVKQSDLDAAKLQVRLDRLNRMVANPRIKPEGIDKAIAELLALQLEMDKLDRKSTDSGGFMSRLGAKFSALGTSMEGAVSNIPLVGGGLGAITPAGSAAIPVLAAIAALLVAIGAALGPLIAGLGAVTAGFGAFAAGAIPVFTQLKQSLSTLSSATGDYQQASLNLDQAIRKSPADMQAYRSALAGLEPDLRNAAKLLTDQNVRWQDLSPSMQRSVTALANNSDALKTLLPDQKKALDALMKQKAAWDALTPAQRQMSQQLSALSGDYRKLQQAVQPEVYQAFGTALDIIKRLMPTLTPLAVAAGRAFDQFLGRIDTWLSSPSGKKFLSWLGTEGPKAIDTFGHALWNVTTAIGQVLYWWDRLGNDVIKGAVSFAEGILGFAKVVAGAMALVANAIMGAFTAIIDGAAKLFGWVPGVGPKLKAAAAQFDAFKSSVQTAFAQGMAQIGGWQRALQNMPKVVKLQGDIADLQNKLAMARTDLAGTTSPVRRAKIQGDISQLQAALARARAELALINGTTVTTFVRTVSTGSVGSVGGRAMAAGGIAGAAAGGLRSNRTIVGEHGFEVLDLPPGTRVHSNPDSQRMLAQAGGPVRVELVLVSDGSDEMGYLRERLRKHIRVRYGGSVTAALGA